MNTKGEIISRLRITLKEMSSDTQYSNRYLWNAFNTAAKVLIQRDADQKRKIYKTNNVWQNICVEMEPVSPILCSCISLPMDATIYRSAFRIPKTLESSFGVIYRNLSTLDNSKQLTIVSPIEYQIKSNLRYNKGGYAFFYDGYLWANTTYSNLTLSAIFEDNENDEVKYEDLKCNKAQCKDCGNKSNANSSAAAATCLKRLEEEVNVPDYLVDSCLKMALQEIGSTLTKPNDNHPNNSESQKEVSP